MKKYFQSLLLMFQFMTRIPIKINLPCQKEDFKRGTMFLPITGFIIGLIQWVIFIIAEKVLPINITAVLVVLAGIIVTGALHMDGLGDTCDGFFALKGKEKIIDIMKDSRIGTYACLAVICDILLKASAISDLTSIKGSFVIIAAPMIGRLALVILFYFGKTAKANGTGNLFIGNTGKLQLFIAITFTLITSILLMGLLECIVIIGSTVILILFFNAYCNKKLGGLSGDILGAGNEIAEIVVFIISAIFIKLYL